MGRGQENRGASHRVQRVEREVRDVVGTMLLAGLSADIPSFVSVSRVQMSADLRIARVYVVTMSQVPKPEPTLDEAKNEADDREYKKKLASERKTLVMSLNDNAYEVQAAIARKLQMRFTPRVTFFYDEGFDNALRVETILGKLSPKPASKKATDEE